MRRSANAVAEALKELLAQLAVQSNENWRGTLFHSGEFNRVVCRALAKDLEDAGIGLDEIHTEVRLENIDGYISGTRDWDLVASRGGSPVLLVEVLVNLSSFDKNYKNRLNDIVALSTGLQRAFDDPARAPFRPALVVTLIVGVAGAGRGQKASDQRKALSSTADSLTRMMQDGLLSAAHLILVDTDLGTVSEPFETLSFDRVVTILSGSGSATFDCGVGDGAMAARLGRAFSRGSDVSEVVSGLISTPEGLSAAEAAIVKTRRNLVSELQQLALARQVNESKMHRAIGRNYWLFGGQYVGILDRRELLPLDQYDIPLVCADGSLEIIELKGPEAALTRGHRSHLIVSNEVHAAVSQCLNYLRSLDELGASLTTYFKNESGVALDLRRAKGTVVIGHPTRESSGEVTRERIDQTVRSYNSHLSRLEVISYADLLESAERALQFSAANDVSQSE